jgi:signal transduction histidine kinase
MPDLFRAAQLRLVGWTVVVTAVFISLFSAATFLLLEKNVQRRTDEGLADTCRELVQAVALESRETNLSLVDVIRSEVEELSARNRDVAVLAADGAVIAASGKNVLGLARMAAPERFVDRSNHRIYATSMVVQSERFLVVAARPHEEQEKLLESVGEVFWYAAPLWIALSGLAGWVLVRKSLEPAKAMSEQQRRFMADASHELRTPLSIVRGESEVALTRERSVAELRDALSVIRHESVLLTSIVDDLFLLARADAGQRLGQRLLSPTKFYLNELLTDAARAVRTLALEKAIALEVIAPEDVAIEADEKLIARMIGNLLENAVKYTPRGGRVTMTLVSPRVITVRDSGNGIPAEEQTRIFERFYRGARAEGDGAGLGLSIARSIAELHGGRLDLLESNQNGSTFRVTL